MIKNLQSLFNINECCIFFSYIKVSKDSSDKHNQNNKKKKCLKKLVKSINIFLKKKRTKSKNMVEDDIKIFLSMKNTDHRPIERRKNGQNMDK